MFIFLIKDIREEKEISLYQLSKMTGISYSYLFDLENNRKDNPTLKVLHKISIVFEKNIKDLYIATSDIETVRNWMHKSIEENGLNHPKTYKYSHLLDELLNMLQEEKKEK